MASLNRTVQIRGDLARQYDDVYSDTALDAIAALAELNEPRLDLMRRRIARRAERARERRRIDFLASGATIAGTGSRSPTPAPAGSPAAPSPATCSASGSRAPGRAPSPTRRCRAASAT